MALLDIIRLPDPLLRRSSKPVARVTAETRKLMDDMLETMYEAPGIGLAAVQIGVPERVLVMDLARDEEPKSPIFMVNPEIIWSSEQKSDYEEGCLSIPEFFEMVTRPSEVKVQYRDRQGEPREMHATGVLATCVQHEIDHLNGVLFIERMDKKTRGEIDEQVKALAKETKAAGKK